jgi:hypothetical protein
VIRSILLSCLLKTQLSPQDLDGLRLEVSPPLCIANDFHGASIRIAPNGLAAHPQLASNFSWPKELLGHPLSFLY